MKMKIQILLTAMMIYFGIIIIAAQIPPCESYGSFNIITSEVYLQMVSDAMTGTFNCSATPGVCETLHDLLYDTEDIIANIFNGHAVGDCLDCMPDRLVRQARQLSALASSLNTAGRRNSIGNIYTTILQWQNRICTGPPLNPPPIKISWSLTGTWTVNTISDFTVSISDHPLTGGYLIDFGGKRVIAEIVDEDKIFVKAWNSTGVVGLKGQAITWPNQRWGRISTGNNSQGSTSFGGSLSETSDYPCRDEEMQGTHNASLATFSDIVKLYRHGDTFCNRKKGWYLILRNSQVERYEKKHGMYQLVSSMKVVNVKNQDNGKTRHVLENNDWLTVY